MKLLQTITELSHEFGTPDYVKGGGGNTSAKSADTLWVKPSGTMLATLTEDAFIAMDRRKLSALYTTAMPDDATAREALVKDLMAAAVLPGQKGRASVEAPLHDIMTGELVVHTHPPLVNGMTCAKRGAETCASLFPDALWMPYVDPGFTLCMEVRRRYQGQSVIFLENHGVFVAGHDAEELRAAYGRILDRLRGEYANAGVALTLASASPATTPEPVTPDHIVYRNHPQLAPVMAADSALIRQLAEAFGGVQLLDARARHFIETWEVESYRQRQVASP